MFFSSPCSRGGRVVAAAMVLRVVVIVVRSSMCLVWLSAAHRSQLTTSRVFFGFDILYSSFCLILLLLLVSLALHVGCPEREVIP